MRLWFGLLALVVALGATIAADTIPAQGGNIEVTPMAHAHVQIEHGGKVIHIDPQPQAPQASIKPADLILITDVHGDHFDPKAIDMVDKPTTVIVIPQALAGKAPGKAEVINNGQTRTIEGVQIEALPAYNLQRGPKPGAFYHEKGRGNMYLLTLGGQRLLFTGDTECTPELKAVTKIDVAFIVMNLPFTMTPQEAADCVKAFKPRIVYPYHYREQKIEPANKNQTDFVAAMKGAAGIEVRAREFYPQ